MIFSLTWRFLLLFGGLTAGVVLFFSGHPFLGILVHAVIVTYSLAGTLNPSSRLFGKIQTDCQDHIWLTLDDGPDPEDTPAILDLLDQFQAKATFFVIGKKAEIYPELIREIHSRGHQIGNHSQHHPHSTFWSLGPIRAYREITECQQTIKKITGTAPTLFRAPVGHFNMFIHPVLKRENLRLIGWNSRGFDGVSASLPLVSARIRQSMGPGSIVLAHEGTPIAKEVVADILAHAAANNWQIKLPDASRQSGNY
ncbi:polysaccharide deacetylase family protein [Luteolibacter sp. AS25]|uniref:polysaccharide deacetylase family protein n=1 Tax=Luteolibacter sp. AS25 TaxID=3135776 RepID=UPI00398B25F1